jgi:hypothetical protein
MEDGELSAAIDVAQDTEKLKPYISKGSIGASAIGNTCDALLAFSLRGFPDVRVHAQLRRIFRDGHRIEDQVVRDIRLAGYNLMENDPMTGKQWTWRKYGLLAVFKADGLMEIDNETLLVEIKSMNNTLWKKFKDIGIKYSHPYYYDQMQMGMGMSGIHKCVMIAYNKDNSKYWDETVEFNPVRYGFLMHRIESAMSGPNYKVSRRAEDWRCKGCFKRDVCWNDAPVEKTIRTCRWSKAQKDGNFVCLKGLKCKGCTEYEQWKPRGRL